MPSQSGKEHFGALSLRKITSSVPSQSGKEQVRCHLKVENKKFGVLSKRKKTSSVPSQRWLPNGNLQNDGSPLTLKCSEQLAQIGGLVPEPVIAVQ